VYEVTFAHFALILHSVLTI